MTDVNEEFERITEDQEFTSAFSALYRQARIQVWREASASGSTFDPWKIGARAWGRLTIDQQPEAFRELFHQYWRTDESDLEDERIDELAKKAGPPALSEQAYEELQIAVACGPEDGGTTGEIDFRLLLVLLDEVSVLRRKIALLRDMLIEPGTS
jgi:hypothetical protein